MALEGVKPRTLLRLLGRHPQRRRLRREAHPQAAGNIGSTLAPSATDVRNGAQRDRTHLDPGSSRTPPTAAAALNLDVAEIFKPIVVDRVIFSSNRGALKARGSGQSDRRGVFREGPQDLPRSLRIPPQGDRAAPQIRSRRILSAADPVEL